MRIDLQFHRFLALEKISISTTKKFSLTSNSKPKKQIRKSKNYTLNKHINIYIYEDIPQQPLREGTDQYHIYKAVS